MKFNKLPGSYFVYWIYEDPPYIYRCRFCNNEVDKNAENTQITIQDKKGRSVKVMCCNKPECKEMAVIVGIWDVPSGGFPRRRGGTTYVT